MRVSCRHWSAKIGAVFLFKKGGQRWRKETRRCLTRLFESPDGLYIEMVYENKAFVPYRPIKETQDLPIDAKCIPLLTRIFGKNILAEIGGDKIFITTGKYAVNFWCWKK